MRWPSSKEFFIVMATSKIFPRVGRSGRFTRLSSGLQSSDLLGRFSVVRGKTTAKSLVEPKYTPGHMARHPMESNLRSLLTTIWKNWNIRFWKPSPAWHRAYASRLVTTRASVSKMASTWFLHSQCIVRRSVQLQHAVNLQHILFKGSRGTTNSVLIRMRIKLKGFRRTRFKDGGITNQVPQATVLLLLINVRELSFSRDPRKITQQFAYWGYWGDGR
jgi:hypothetical protein